MDIKLWVRRIFLLCYDIVTVGLVSAISLAVRFDFRWSQVPENYAQVMWSSLIVSEVVTVLIFTAFHLYSSLWSYASSTELMSASFSFTLLCFSAASAAASAPI